MGVGVGWLGLEGGREGVEAGRSGSWEGLEKVGGGRG